MANTITVPQDPYTQGWQTGQYRTGLLQAYPGGMAIQSQLRGELAPDVLANLYQRGAEAGVSRGMPGGPGVNAATMRAMGLTSYDIQNQGLKNLSDIYRLPHQPPGTDITLNVPGLQNTDYPIGGGPVAGGAGGAGGGGGGTRGAGGTPSPAAPTQGYDSFLEDWMRRAGVGGSSGGSSGFALGGPGGTTGATAGAANLYMSGIPAGTTSFADRDIYDPTGAGLYFPDFGTPPGTAPEGTTSFEDQSIYDPSGAGLYFFGGENMAALPPFGQPGESSYPEYTVSTPEADIYDPFAGYYF